MSQTTPNPSADALKMVSECGLRPSPQRIAVAEYVLSHLCHPTADEIYSGLKSRYPSLSRTTVYNTLHSFAAHGAVLEVNVEPGITRFDGCTTPHAHFKCSRCGRIFDLNMSQMAFPEEFKISSFQVNLTGECPECDKLNRLN
ncbi:MAG: transcriptional repressor [Paramuribaculum sp.]|nr:transcriptional repressor [Paramuribaculum sp.]MDE6460403.1 transcriptional repressor [Paramuribaculum sp.]